MINRHLLWVSLLCVILITPLSLRAQNQTPPSEEFNVNPKTPPQATGCQDAEAVENRRYNEVQLQIQIEQNDLNAKRQEELIDCQNQNQPECSNGVNDKYDKASRGIDKRAIEEQKTHLNKLDEINTHCREAQIVPQGTSCQDVKDADENRRYEEVQLRLRIEQNDLNAKRQEELVDCQSQNQPECSNSVNDKYDRALRGTDKRAIEEQKTHLNKMLEISKTCLAQSLPNPSKSPLPGNVSKNRFPDEQGHTDPGDSIPFPYPHLGSQEIIVKVNGDHGDGELIEGNVKQGPNPDQTKWVYRYAKGIVHRDPEDRNKDTFEIQELTDLNGNKYDAQHPIPVPNPPYPNYPFPIIIHLHPTGP
jgi:hypothetical protein